MENSSGGHKQILVSYRKKFISIPLFKFRTLNLVLCIFENSRCMKSTKYCKLVLIIGSWRKTWIVQVLPWGVLDGTIRCSLLSGVLSV